MPRIRWHFTTIFAILVAQLALTANAKADPVADFYRGKTVRVIIGYGAGGNYDLYGRVATEFLSRHIPGQSDRHRGEHAGSRRLQGGRLPLPGGAAGRHASRRAPPAARADPARRRQDGHRSATLQLSRPSRLDGRCRGGAAEKRHQVVRRHAQAGGHRRRRPVDLDVGHLRTRPERVCRIPLQDRHRLQRHGGNSARRRARRSRRERR